ncbi:copi associated protein [Cystoisospora suis]|uniref:Copi associated protein n=1 Tax=Cystoisospora suis TaxID=483139 RepID=A0A2C6KM22_9APIC|nr:copi associated protein [Cystoisospora suis]
MGLMGVMCILVHFGLRQQLRQRGIAVSDEEEEAQHGGSEDVLGDGRIRVGEQLNANYIRSTLFNIA